jgi:uncharacterized protein (DUF885 family)
MNFVQQTSRCCLVLAGLLVLSCGGQPDRGGDPSTDDPVALALAVSQEYVDGYYHQFPEEAYEFGYPNPPLDRYSDRSPEALAAWHAREDMWLETLQSIDQDTLEETEAAVPHTFALHQLERSRDLRICRFELWTVSPTWTGWQDFMPANFARQTVGTDEARADALARTRDVARFIETDIANLRLGLSLGYTAPRSGVEATIRLTDSLLENTPEASPFYEPAVRDGTDAFAGSLRAVIEDEINPAIRRYHEFLSTEYLPAARDSIAITDTPGGNACYSAALRFHTSLTLSPNEIHEIGLREMERLHDEMRVIGRRSFGIDDPRELLEHVRSSPAYRFESEQEILDYARTAMERAKEAVPDMVGFVPQAEITVTPYPKYLKRTGGGLQTAGSPDGSMPAKYEIGTYDPKSLGRAEIEALTFHETYPGHHLQTAVAMEKGGVHPLLRYIFFNATGEGWALYTEKLADEMALYSSDLSQIGRLSSEAWRAARLVVDPGMHALGWTRQQAIDYMLENTSSSKGEVVYEVDRYIAVPAQAVSYLIGSLEIQRLRRLAEERLGDRFDIRAFHDAVLEDGTVTLGMLQRKIERWIESENND